MLTVISPAKTLDFETPIRIRKHSTPEFLKESRKLVRQLREFSADELGELMGVSEKLAELNQQRYQDWKTPFTPDNARQTVLAFSGDVYDGLRADTWKSDDFQFAQKRLRILSGLYGLLRPLDLIQPYRLEMGTKLETDRGSNLYEFWGDRITEAVNEQMSHLKSDVLLNLASQEYFKVLKKGALNALVITPDFRDWKNGQYRMISFYAKKARGTMSAWIVRNRIKDAQELRNFDADGYRFSSELSQDDRWVFTRTPGSETN